MPVERGQSRRPRDEVALTERNPAGPDDLEVLRRLDPFGDDGTSDPSRERLDRLQEQAAPRMGGGSRDERTVELQEVGTQLDEEMEIAEPGAEIVDGKEEAFASERKEQARENLRLLDAHDLGELEDDSIGPEPRRPDEAGDLHAGRPFLQKRRGGQVEKQETIAQWSRRREMCLQGSELELHEEIGAESKIERLVGTRDAEVCWKPQERLVSSHDVMPHGADGLEDARQLETAIENLQNPIPWRRQGCTKRVQGKRSLEQVSADSPVAPRGRHACLPLRSERLRPRVPRSGGETPPRAAGDERDSPC